MGGPGPGPFCPPYPLYPALQTCRVTEQLVKKCSICNKYRNKQPNEPLIPHPIPDRPWKKVGVDIFTLYGKVYLIVVDYYSKYPKVSLLKGKTAFSVIDHLKEVFAVMEFLRWSWLTTSSSTAMRDFASEWNLKIITSSPNYAQSNGQAERAIQTVKKLFKKGL